jgi:hypothetical protein
MNVALHCLGILGLVLGPILIPAAMLAWGARNR